MNQDQTSLENFNGLTRLFPLPNLVFFPQALQPLHIFEPRYRQMMADALSDDKLLSLVLLEPGWEDDYDHRPAIHEVACLGRIAADQLLPDGRYNLLLRGLSRVRILEEIPNDKLYRTARVELLPNLSYIAVEKKVALRKELADLLLPRFDDKQIVRQITELFDSEMPLGSVCDVLTFGLPLPIEIKQIMLEQVVEEQRCLMLLEGIATLPFQQASLQAGAKRFPPNFSPN